jgi:hypothetical protein
LGLPIVLVPTTQGSAALHPGVSNVTPSGSTKRRAAGGIVLAAVENLRRRLSSDIMTANRCLNSDAMVRGMTVRFLSSRPVYRYPAVVMLAVAAMFLSTIARGADEGAADGEKMSAD